MAQAKYEPDAQKAIDLAIQATKQLVDDTQKTTGAEAEQYFQQLQMPQAKQN
jgi:hypothetical protein